MSEIRIGLDIGTYSVKFVQLKQTGQKSVVINSGYKEFGSAAEISEERISESLKELWEEHSLKSKVVRLAVSDQSVYTRQVEAVKTDDEAFQRSLRLQAEKYLPFPANEAMIDYQVLSSEHNSAQSKQNVILTATDNKTINRYTSILSEAGLNPIVLEPVMFSIAKAAVLDPELDSRQILPVIDLGAKSTIVSVVQGGELVFAKCIPLGSQIITDAIKEKRSIDAIDAEQMKRDDLIIPSKDISAEEHSEIYKTVVPQLDELLGEINRCFMFIESLVLDQSIPKVYLSGGGALMKGLENYFTEQLSSSVEKAEPFKGVKVVSKKEAQKLASEDSLRLMGALGAAL